MKNLKEPESARSSLTDETKWAIGIGIVAIVAAGVACVAPDEVKYEDDTVHLFGVPVGGKRGIVFRWGRS